MTSLRKELFALLALKMTCGIYLTTKRGQVFIPKSGAPFFTDQGRSQYLSQSEIKELIPELEQHG